MANEERRFQELLSKVTARESSTLVVATVASSASLVLLGFTISHESLLYWSGVFFPIGGFAYRELTIFYVDRYDYEELRQLVGTPLKTSRWRKSQYFRSWLLRIFLIAPSLIWLAAFTTPNRIFGVKVAELGPVRTPISLIIAGLVAAVLVYWESRCVGRDA